MANKVIKIQWNKKVDIYIYENNTKIHLCRPNLLWCYVRDVSPKEQESYDLIYDDRVSTVMYINYNPTILNLKWVHGRKKQQNIWARVNNRTYLLMAKPDEFDHNKGEMKVLLYEELDTTKYDNEIWET